MLELGGDPSPQPTGVGFAQRRFLLDYAMKKMAETLPVLVVAGLCLASPVLADGRVDAITRQLTDQGFGEIKVSKTFLGRVRVEALRDGREREIIFNPRTGEILRDYWDIDASGTGGWLLGTGARGEDDRENRAGNRRAQEEAHDDDHHEVGGDDDDEEDHDHDDDDDGDRDYDDDDNDNSSDDEDDD